MAPWRESYAAKQGLKARVGAQGIPVRPAETCTLRIMICVSPVEPVDGTVLVPGVEISQGDTRGRFFGEFGLFVPCRKDIGDGPLRSLVSAFREARSKAAMRSVSRTIPSLSACREAFPARAGSYSHSHTWWCCSLLHSHGISFIVVTKGSDYEAQQAIGVIHADSNAGAISRGGIAVPHSAGESDKSPSNAQFSRNFSALLVSRTYSSE